MDQQLEKLRGDDGSWDRFVADWRSQCETLGEDFDQYAVGTLSTLEDMAAADPKRVGVVALLSEEGGYEAVAQVNSTPLPGYEGKVLRVCNMLLSPNFDFGERTIEDYANTMSRMFSRTVYLAVNDMPSQHVKFHLRSPADQKFFQSALSTLKDFAIFSNVAMRGAWLYLSLNKPVTAPVDGENA